ncbi:MAG: WD40 repeat domain-containing protein [Caldiserica bacterium]|nr:WD40 repeat domain-containing protein [Caldisericota bacterium]
MDRLTVLVRWGKGMAKGAEWSPDGRYLAVPAGLGVYLHDARTLEEVRYIPVATREDYIHMRSSIEFEFGPVELRGDAFFYDAMVGHIAFSPDGRFLAVGFAGESVFTKGGLPVARVLDTATWQVIVEVGSLSGSPSGLAFSPDGRYLAVSEWDRISVWDVRALGEGEVTQYATYVTGGMGWGGVEGLVFSPDSRWLAGVRDGEGYVWEVKPGTRWPDLLMVPEAGSWYMPASAVAFSPDSKEVVFAGDEGIVRGYRLDTGRPLDPQEVGGWCEALAFLPNGRLLYGRLTGEVVVWDLRAGRKVATWKGDPSQRAVERLRLSPDGRRALVQRAGSLLEVFDTATGRLLGVVSGYHGDGVALAAGYAPDASLLAFSEEDTVVLVDASTGEEVGLLRGGGYNIYDLALSPDGRLAAVSYEDESLWLWDVKRGKVRFRLKRGTEDYPINLSALAFSPDGRYLASVEFTQRVLTLWDTRNGRRVRVWRDVPSDPDAIAFSPDGRLLAVNGHFDNRVRLWDMRTGRVLHDIDLSFGEFNLNPSELLFSPDGRYLAVIGEGRPRMALFDVETGDLVWQSEFYGDILAFSPDGSLVVGGTAVFDVETGEMLRALAYTTMEDVGAAQFYFSPDGTKLYMIDSSGLVWVWGVPPES